MMMMMTMVVIIIILIIRSLLLKLVHGKQTQTRIETKVLINLRV